MVRLDIKILPLQLLLLFPCGTYPWNIYDCVKFLGYNWSIHLIFVQRHWYECRDSIFNIRYKSFVFVCMLRYTANRIKTLLDVIFNYRPARGYWLLTNLGIKQSAWAEEGFLCGIGVFSVHVFVCYYSLVLFCSSYVSICFANSKKRHF